jgi:hypothetical protein
VNVNDEFSRLWNEADVAYLKVLSKNLTGIGKSKVVPVLN